MREAAAKEQRAGCSHSRHTQRVFAYTMLCYVMLAMLLRLGAHERHDEQAGDRGEQLPEEREEARPAARRELVISSGQQGGCAGAGDCGFGSRWAHQMPSHGLGSAPRFHFLKACACGRAWHSSIAYATLCYAMLCNGAP